MKRKLLAGILSVVLSVTMLAGCSGNESKDAAKSESKESGKESGQAADTASDSTSDDDKVQTVDGDFTVGISQFAQHGSLENCKIGFISGLESEGFVEGVNLTVEEQNANADTGIANQIAQAYVSTKVDLICAIATPSAQSAYNAVKSMDIPSIYTAVNDPVAAGLADEDKMPVGNTTGTSDKLPVEAQLEMIREILPEAKTIGIIYTTSEVNSETTIKEYKEAVEKYGFELETVGVSSLAEVPAAADSLLEKVDCLNNLTDNTVVSALQTILNKANNKGIPVFGSEVEQVRNGCLAAEGIDYIDLGFQTGVIAGRVLKGEKASEIPFETIAESKFYINEKAAEGLNITFDDSVKSKAAEIFTEIE
jgi:putative ABC transport system substrate-binding protein